MPVDVLVPFQKTGYGGRAYRDVSANSDIAITQFARDDLYLFLGRRVFHPQEIVGQGSAETPMNFADTVSGDSASFQAANVDPLLDFDMRFSLHLEVALLDVAAVISLERALDVDRVCIVPFDEIAVVAVHCANEIRQGGNEA